MLFFSSGHIIAKTKYFLKARHKEKMDFTVGTVFKTERDDRALLRSHRKPKDISFTT